MKFCSVCQTPMQRNISSGELMFRCKRCHNEEPSDDWDVCVMRDDMVKESGMFKILIDNSAYVREAQRVKKKCPNCFRNTMVAVRVDVHENVTYRCECGGTEEVISTLSRS